MTCIRWQVTGDTWHMTHDMWNMTHDTWWGKNIISKFQLFWFGICSVWKIWSKRDDSINKTVNELMNDGGDCRTALRAHNEFWVSAHFKFEFLSYILLIIYFLSSENFITTLFVIHLFLLHLIFFITDLCDLCNFLITDLCNLRKAKKNIEKPDIIALIALCTLNKYLKKNIYPN